MRKGVQVLDGLNIEIPKGKTVALVGPSGCGKSTCMQLLLRYYDPIEGSVELDQTATTNYPLSRIRAKLGLVSQEPILFDRTIAENIAYGDNERKVPMSNIIEAAKAANIHDFISKLPKGYETGLGSKGSKNYHEKIQTDNNFFIFRCSTFWRSETKDCDRSSSCQKPKNSAFR